MKIQAAAIAVLYSCTLIADEPRLSCERKWGEMTWEGMQFKRYHLRAENFPPKQRFRLIVKSYDGTETETFTYRSNKKGHLILEPVEEAGTGDIYALCPAKRGERLTFLMQALEGKGAYTAEVVPFPLEMTSKHGVVLNLELQGEKGEIFLLTARGLNPQEEISLSCECQGKTLHFDGHVTASGELFSVVSVPINDQEKGGGAKLILKRKQEEIFFPFECGPPALKFVGACCLEIQ